MHRGRRRPGDTSDADNPYWVSFTDLMTALLAVFMLAVVALVLQVTQEQQALAAQQEAAEEERDEFSSHIADLSRAEDVRAQMLLEIADGLQSQGLAVHVSEDNSVLSIPTELLGFESSEWELRPEHQAVALQIGESISAALRTDDRFRYIDTVFVEGHTDNNQFEGVEGTGNWGLSTFRAISLWRYWETALPADHRLATLQRSDGSPLFSVSGYGETRPVTSQQTTDAERAANRRIEIRFTVIRPTAEDLSRLLDEAPAEEG